MGLPCGRPTTQSAKRGLKLHNEGSSEGRDSERERARERERAERNLIVPIVCCHPATYMLAPNPQSQDRDMPSMCDTWRSTYGASIVLGMIVVIYYACVYCTYLPCTLGIDLCIIRQTDRQNIACLFCSHEMIPKFPAPHVLVRFYLSFPQLSYFPFLWFHSLSSPPPPFDLRYVWARNRTIRSYHSSGPIKFCPFRKPTKGSWSTFMTMNPPSPSSASASGPFRPLYQTLREPCRSPHSLSLSLSVPVPCGPPPLSHHLSPFPKPTHSPGHSIWSFGSRKAKASSLGCVSMYTTLHTMYVLFFGG